MLVVETIAKIRRAYFAQNKPIKTICREFRVSRRVVRKVIRSQATEFRYERSRQPLPRIDPWRDQLDGLLLENEGKPARERLTLIRIFEELRALGYEGSYDAVRRYAKRWRAERGAATAQAYVPLSFAPGEAYQFDWTLIRLFEELRALDYEAATTRFVDTPRGAAPRRHKPMYR